MDNKVIDELIKEREEDFESVYEQEELEYKVVNKLGQLIE